MTASLPDPLVPADVDLRRAAALRGARRYFSGKPCPAGHNAERYTLNSYCIECQREMNRADRARVKSQMSAAGS